MSLKVRRQWVSVVGVVASTLLAPLVLAGSCSDSNVSSGSDANFQLDIKVVEYEGSSPSDASTGPDTSGGLSDFTTGWERVAWAPNCPLFQPKDLSVVPVPNWVACSSGRSGCTEMARDWSTRPDATAPVVYERSSSPTSTEILLYREYSTYQYEYVVWDTSHGVEAAWRSNGDGTQCIEVLGDIAAGTVSLTEAEYLGSKSVQTYAQVYGSAAETMAKASPDYTFTPADIGFSSSLQMSVASASPSVATLFFGQLDLMGIRDRVANSVDPLDAGAGTRVEVNPYYSVVGDDVFFSSTGGIYAWSRGQGLQLLVPSTGSAYEHDVASDGTTLIWIESTNPTSSGFANASLFASPAATTAAGLSPHKIIDINCTARLCESTIGGGYATVGLNPLSGTTHQFLLVRLSDNAYWTLANGSTDLWGVGKVVNSELWIPALVGGYDTVERVDISSLGAPSTD